MSDDSRSPIIKPAIDATGMRAGADEVKRAARDMATAVGAEGRRAGQGAEGIGEGARRGADRTEAETRRMVAAIQRVQAEVQAGSRNSSAYFEAIARQRGVDVAQLQPYLDGLKAAETAQKGATAGLNAMGMTARQTTAALRQVPAQFADIVTGLASGQQPLMVLLQQGGQLKDVFGGAGAAARALGGYVAGLLTPFTLLAGAGAAVAAAFVLGRKESQAYAAALAMSGNAAGTTVSQLGEMARAIDAVSGATQGKAAEVLTQLAAAGDVGAQNLQRFARAAIELERAGGPAAEQTARAFSELARSPLQASLKLTESMRYLSAATFEQIAELERQGRATDAARVAQDAYAAALEQRVPQMVDRLGLFERAWLGVADASKQALDIFLDIGRRDTLQQQLEALNVAIGTAQRVQGSDGGGLLGRFFRGREQGLIAQRDLLLEQIRLTDRAAQAAGQRARTEQANIVWLQGQAQYMDRTARLALEVNKIREQGLAAGRTEEEIAERIRALVQQTYGARADNGENAAARERERALERQARLLAELSGLTASYQQDLAALDAMRRAGNISEERYGELVRELVARQPIVRQGAQEAARAAQEQARAVQALRTQYEAYLQGLDRTVGAGEKLLAGLRSEYIALTAGKQVRDDLQLVELERLAVAYEHALVTAELNDQERVRYERLLAQTREEILLRRSIMSATASAEARRANERAAEEAARQWQQASEQISQSLADALMRGGRNAAEYLRGLFRTMVFKPLLEQAVKPFTEYIQGGLQWLYGSAATSAATKSGSGGSGSGAAAAGASSVSAYAAYAALIYAAMREGKADYARGFTRYSADSSGTALGDASARTADLMSRLGISDRWADILSGATLTARMFGHGTPNVIARGVTGNFAGGAFSGQAFEDWHAEGGWFRSDKRGTNLGALDGTIAQAISDSSRQVYQQAQEYARVLGLPLERLSGVTAAARIQLGDDAEANRQAVAEALQAYGSALAESFQTELARYGRAWETTLETFQRLAGLQQFSRDLSALGGVFGRVATLAVDTREQLIDFAGGMDALRDQALSFVQQYYSRDEIAGLKAREIQSVLQALGITQDVNSRDQFRALVDNTDVGSEAGRRRLAQLLAIGDDFAGLADYLTETGGTLSGAAALAPAGGQLAELFAQPAQAQVEAINNVVAGVLRVELAIERLTAAVQADRTIVMPNSWEVSPP